MSATYRYLPTTTPRETENRATLQTILDTERISLTRLMARIGLNSTDELRRYLNGEDVPRIVVSKINRYLGTPVDAWNPAAITEYARVAQEPPDARNPDIRPVPPASGLSLPEGFAMQPNRRAKLPVALIIQREYRMRLTALAVEALHRPTDVWIAVNAATRSILILPAAQTVKDETYRLYPRYGSVCAMAIGRQLLDWGRKVATPYPLIAAHGGLLLTGETA